MWGSQRRFLNTAAAITATSGLLFEYYTDVISGALLLIREDFAPLSAFTGAAIISFLLVGAVVGRLSGGDRGQLPRYDGRVQPGALSKERLYERLYDRAYSHLWGHRRFDGTVPDPRSRKTPRGG